MRETYNVKYSIFNYDDFGLKSEHYERLLFRCLVLSEIGANFTQRQPLINDINIIGKC